MSTILTGGIDKTAEKGVRFGYADYIDEPSKFDKLGRYDRE